MATRTEARAAEARRQTRRARLAVVVLLLAGVGGGAAWSKLLTGPPSQQSSGEALAASAAARPAPPAQASRQSERALPSPRPSPRPPPSRPPPSRPPPSPSPDPPRTVTLAFTGDLLPHTPVIRAAQGHGAQSGEPYDFRPLFAPVASTLEAADLALCHLEVPLTTDHARISSFPTFNAPAELADAVADAGWQGCSTASNHSVDQGFEGVVATLDALDTAGLGSVGTARSEAEAALPARYDVDGVAVGHLSYTDGLNGLPLPDGAPWAVDLVDGPTIVADAAAARGDGADIVVVSLHWGEEYRTEPTAQQRELAEELAGSPDVDLLVGHHAHVVQPIERIGDTVVVYGLGNFLSGQSAACCTGTPATQDGVVARVTFTEEPPDSGRGFLAGDVTVSPTWVDRPGYRVLPVLPLLADPDTPPDLAAALAASRDRTLEAVGPSAAVPSP